MSKDDYEVGYGKPPKHTRFAPGESGNKGRKKKPPETHAQVVARIRDEILTVNGARITMFEVAVRTAITNTIKRGNPRDIKAMFEILDKYGALPEGDKYAEMKAGADEVLAKLDVTFQRMLNIDPEEQATLNRHREEEVALVLKCPSCGPELRRRWHLPARKAMADRDRHTQLQHDADQLRKKARPK